MYGLSDELINKIRKISTENDIKFIYLVQELEEFIEQIRILILQ